MTVNDGLLFGIFSLFKAISPHIKTRNRISKVNCMINFYKIATLASTWSLVFLNKYRSARKLPFK